MPPSTLPFRQTRRDLWAPFASLGLLLIYSDHLGSQVVPAAAQEKLLTNSPWVQSLKAYFRAAHQERSSPPNDAPWNETPVGINYPRDDYAKNKTLKLTVEWSSAPPIRLARQALGKPLDLSAAAGQYVISVRGLPPSVTPISAELLRSGHPDIGMLTFKRTAPDVVSCLFPSSDPITSSDVQVRFHFQSPELVFVVTFAPSAMLYQNELVLF